MDSYVPAASMKRSRQLCTKEAWPQRPSSSSLRAQAAAMPAKTRELSTMSITSQRTMSMSMRCHSSFRTSAIAHLTCNGGPMDPTQATALRSAETRPGTATRACSCHTRSARSATACQRPKMTCSTTTTTPSATVRVVVLVIVPALSVRTGGRCTSPACQIVQP